MQDINPYPLAPREGDIIVRQSTIGSMQLCPGRVGLSNKPGFIATPSKPMYRGTLAHATIASALRLEGSEVHLAGTPSRVEILALMDELTEEQNGFHPSQVATVEQIDELISEAQDIMASWVATVWEPRMQFEKFLMVEEKVLMPLAYTPSGAIIWLQGTPDAVAESGIFDWKTGAKQWTVNAAGQSKGSFGPQAPLYLALAQHRLGGELAKDFTFVVYAVDRQQWEFHKTRWTREQVDAAIANAIEVGHQIAGGGFPYTPYVSEFGKNKRGWHCSPQYCGAWNVCPGKNMLADGYDTTQVATPGW